MASGSFIRNSMKINGMNIPYPLLAGLVTAIFWLSGLSYGVRANDEDIEELKEVPLKIVKIESHVEHIEESVGEIKDEQKLQRAMLDAILLAVKDD